MATCRGAGQLDQAIFSLTAKVMHHESLAAAATEKSLAAAQAEHELQVLQLQHELEQVRMRADPDHMSLHEHMLLLSWPVACCPDHCFNHRACFLSFNRNVQLVWKSSSSCRKRYVTM